MSSRVLSYTGTRVWPDSITLSTTSSQGVLDREHVHFGPRRHDVRDHGVAQLDHALDHLAGIFLEQSFAVPLADDRANFLFERFLVRRRVFAAGNPVQHRVQSSGKPHQREKVPWPNMLQTGQV